MATPLAGGVAAGSVTTMGGAIAYVCNNAATEAATASVLEDGCIDVGEPGGGGGFPGDDEPGHGGPGTSSQRPLVPKEDQREKREEEVVAVEQHVGRLGGGTAVEAEPGLPGALTRTGRSTTDVRRHGAGEAVGLVDLTSGTCCPPLGATVRPPGPAGRTHGWGRCAAPRGSSRGQHVPDVRSTSPTASPAP